MSWTDHSTAVRNTHAPILYVSLCWKCEKEEKKRNGEYEVAVASPTIFVLPSDKGEDDE